MPSVKVMILVLCIDGPPVETLSDELSVEANAIPALWSLGYLLNRYVTALQSSRSLHNSYQPALQITCSFLAPSAKLSVLHNGCLQALGVVDVDGLHIAIKLLLGVLFVITLARDTDTNAVRDAFDAVGPDRLVQLRIEADVFGTL